METWEGVHAVNGMVTVRPMYDMGHVFGGQSPRRAPRFGARRAVALAQVVIPAGTGMEWEDIVRLVDEPGPWLADRASPA